jgi:hypothetical protein
MRDAKIMVAQPNGSFILHSKVQIRVKNQQYSFLYDCFSKTNFDFFTHYLLSAILVVIAHPPPHLWFATAEMDGRMRRGGAPRGCDGRRDRPHL